MDRRLSAINAQLRRRIGTSDQLFAVADDNRDDKLNFEEFCRGVARGGCRPVPDLSDMRALFEQYGATACESPCGPRRRVCSHCASLRHCVWLYMWWTLNHTGVHEQPPQHLQHMQCGRLCNCFLNLL